MGKHLQKQERVGMQTSSNESLDVTTTHALTRQLIVPVSAYPSVSGREFRPRLKPPLSFVVDSDCNEPPDSQGRNFELFSLLQQSI
jgi:hypothetical protein